MDLSHMRISNGWILCSFLAGFGLCWTGAGTEPAGFILGTLFPLLFLGWLFYFRMLGPGDIKLFCVLGGIMGPEKVLYCIGMAFAAGALVSLGILIVCGGFRERIRYLLEFLEQYGRTGEKKPYYRTGPAWENIHFTVPIFMSVMFYAGGIY